MKTIRWVWILLFASACQFSAPGSDGRSVTLQASTNSQPLAIHTETTTPLPNPESVTEAPSTIPPLVWLPFENRSYFFAKQIPVIREGELAFEKTPDDLELFWDYDWQTDRLAYADRFSTSSPECNNSFAVSNLKIQDYRKGSNFPVLENVSNAKWSPVPNSETGAPMLAAIVCGNQLYVLPFDQEEGKILVSKNAGAGFSWSPDGMQLAFLRDDSLVTVPSRGGEEKVIGIFISEHRGAAINRPVWAVEHNAIFVSDEPFLIVMLDGSGSFLPLSPDGKVPEGEAVDSMLWDPETRILVADSMEGMGQPVIRVYHLSDDLHTVLESYAISDAGFRDYPLAAWWIPGESVVLSNWEIWTITGDIHKVMVIPHEE